MAHYILGQTNNLTGSPYSLFGLGVTSNANIGINNAIGNGGYAISGQSYINNLNPASYGSLNKETFIFDFGFLTEFSEVANRSTTENRIAGSFSNLAIATSVTPNSSLGLSVTPFSDVGYALIGIESNIEGSLDNFISNVFGSGALNDLRISYGTKLSEKLRAGLYSSYLFGSIEEREVTVANSQATLSVTETNAYRGLRLGLGFQFDLSNKVTIGWGVDLPTVLSGRQDRIISKTLDFSPSTVETTEDEKIDGFKLPAQINSGLLLRPLKGLDLTMDYSLKLWNATDQSDNVGVFVDETDLAIGLQYAIDETSYKYVERLKFRAGFNYNTGYLEVNGNPIDSYRITAGIGIPLGIKSISHLNISYGFQNRGATQGILVEEQIHTLNVNLSLKDFWFKKLKIN